MLLRPLFGGVFSVKAEVCKTSTPSSNLGAALIFSILKKLQLLDLQEL